MMICFCLLVFLLVCCRYLLALSLSMLVGLLMFVRLVGLVVVGICWFVVVR